MTGKSPGLSSACRLASALVPALLALVATAATTMAQEPLNRSAWEPLAAPSLLSSYYGSVPGYERAPLDLLPHAPSHSAPLRVPQRDPRYDLYDLKAPDAAPIASETDTINERISRRYGNPVVIRLLGSMTNQQGLALYRETMRLIDSRHIQPSSYEARVRQALKNLTVALDNAAFRQALRMNVSADGLRSFQQSLQQVAETRPVRNATDAQNVLYWTGDLAQKQLGLRPTVVVAEFIYGAVESLDKYSAFEPEERRSAPSAALEDHVVGIGVEIKPHDQGVIIVKALAGGPAARAGLKKDDVITEIDGRSLRGQSLEFAVDLITGSLGSRLAVRVLRDGQSYSANLTRSRVEIRSVSDVRLLEGGVGYIKLDSFAQKTDQEMDQALWNLHRQGMRSLVLDLRGNPGGLLTTAVSLSDKFLPSGVIVSTRGRTAQDQMAEQAKHPQTWNTPLVVLVDGESASASEIFAAAIQENGRGLVVGSRTYGKGTVQTHFPLSTIAGTLRLTTAKFYSPANREMAEIGVTPDVQIAQLGYRFDSLEGGDRELEVAARVARSSQLRELAQLSSRNTTGR